MTRKVLSTITAILVLAVSITSCGGKQKSQNSVLIKGSDTLLNLVQQLSEAYMKKNPKTEISVIGGGSGVGISALIEGETDIANASRQMKKEEIKRAEANGIEPVEFVIAIDGLAVIVNSNNPVNKLTTEQIAKVFKGEIKNWKDVGGNDEPITLYGRQPVSGTYVFFREHILKGDYAKNMRQMSGNAAIVEAVKSDKTGIGYVGIGYAKNAKGIKILSVSSDGNTFVSPLEKEKVNEGLYPIARPLFQYTAGKPKGAVKKFIEFELSEEGQKIVEEVGFFRIGEKFKKLNAEHLK